MLKWERVLEKLKKLTLEELDMDIDEIEEITLEDMEIEASQGNDSEVGILDNTTHPQDTPSH